MIFSILIEDDGPWIIRIDSPHGNKEYNKKHIHLKRRDLNGEYSWNIDGSRHDKHKFPNNEKFIEKAKKIASEKLNIDKTKFHFINQTNGKNFMSLKNKNKSILSRYYIRKDYTNFIFYIKDTFIIIELNNSILN